MSDTEQMSAFWEAAAQKNGELYAACENQRDEARQERDGAYRERAHLVAWLASIYPSHIGYTDRSSPDWAVVIVQTPAGQMSWHVAPADMELFEDVPRSGPELPGWDGHTTEQKYERLRALTLRRKR